MDPQNSEPIASVSEGAHGVELRLSAVQIYESVVRKMMTEEDNRINDRMLWMAAFNGLLFAALGFAWDKSGARFLAIVFCFLGFAASSLNGISLVFASDGQRRLLRWWKKSQPKPYLGPGIMGMEPRDKSFYSMYFTPWIILAAAFAFGWLAILWFVFAQPPEQSTRNVQSGHATIGETSHPNAPDPNATCSVDVAGCNSSPAAPHLNPSPTESAK